MIDSHCHLDHEPLLSDLNNIIQRAKNIGIGKKIVGEGKTVKQTFPASDLSSFYKWS